MTLHAALLNARYLNLLMRHADRVKMACRSNLANSFCGAIIETSPAGVLKRPSYHVMWLYSHHARPMAISLMQSNDSLDHVACASEDQASLVIFGVNARSEPVNASFQFDGFPKPVRIRAAEVVLDSQDGRQPDAMNHWNAPDRVSTRLMETGQEGCVFPALSVVALECSGL